MESNGVAQSIIVAAIIIPLLTVAHIILAAAGCVAAFYIVRGLFRGLGTIIGKVKVKAKKLGGEVRQEVQRLGGES